jgi:hypothetical protein
MPDRDRLADRVVDYVSGPAGHHVAALAASDWIEHQTDCNIKKFGALTPPPSG